MWTLEFSTVEKMLISMNVTELMMVNCTCMLHVHNLHVSVTKRHTCKHVRKLVTCCTAILTQTELPWTGWKKLISSLFELLYFERVHLHVHTYTCTYVCLWDVWHQCTQVMDREDDRITSDLYAEGGSNYTTISSLAWRYMYIVCHGNTCIAH